ncbi:phosphotransferase enzyme family protein [Prochlorococcus marinus]|uniref:phosphotransferase enzyme family protein n=1 Tax=Prochlorococcus marinus TaxID=1219 RepID=UPI0022B57162|nr:aminoglycoside phosphotransferase family protein [Prochlorococcus marinus]
MTKENLQNIRKIASTFFTNNHILDIKAINSGNINNTFLVSTDSISINKKFILQSINSDVFKNPKDIIDNYSKLEDNILTNLDQVLLRYPRKWFFPKLIKNIVDKTNYKLIDDVYWRSFEYIDFTKTIETITSDSQAYYLLEGLAIFHLLTIKANPDNYITTISNFHNTPKYLSQLYSVVTSLRQNEIHNHKILKEIDLVLKFVSLNKNEAFSLINSSSRKSLSFRLIHGDPKVSNFLFDFSTNKVVSLIDLDTFQMGYLLFDLADCLRSCCNPLGEEPEDISIVHFDLNYYQSALNGYFSIYKDKLTKADIFYLPYSIRTITYELGIRFLTDYLCGNTYFNSNYPTQNLYKAKVQFALLKSIHAQWNKVIKITNSLSM